MNARIAEIEAMAGSEEAEELAEELAVAEWIRSTGGTCGIVPVGSCAADSPHCRVVGLQKGNLPPKALPATGAAVPAMEIAENRRRAEGACESEKQT